MSVGDIPDHVIETNLMTIAMRQVEDKIKRVLVEEGMEDVKKMTAEFEKIMHDLIVKEVDKLVVDLDFRKDLFKLRDDLNVYISWKKDK